ncbi:MAG: FMN-binding protein [Acidobacteria bacterium]|nr:FMN-binding protein [Acidobacteriota bacterium]
MSSIKIIRYLGLISLICGVLIVGAKVLTEDRIRVNQEIINRDSIAQLLPGADKQLTFIVQPSGELAPLTNVDAKGQKLFAGYDKSGKLLGLVFEASERGYGDMISALYAYDPGSKTIIGFTVVEMKETPGLGDKIGKDPDFLANFRKLDTSKPILAVKHGTKKNPWEIDAISGATISSRAVGRMLQKSIAEIAPIIERNRQIIERGNK